MTIEDFNSKQVYLFDAFGTLFKTSDVDVAFKNIAKDKSESLIQVWRRKQLEYSWLRNQMDKYIPFHKVTKDALEYSMHFHDLNDPRIPELLLPIFNAPGLIGGAKAMLIYLKSQNKQVGILSNGTHKMLNNGIGTTDIEDQIDFVFSVDDIGIYKPHPAVYQMAVNKLGRPKEELLFFSSNQWDVSGASIFGLDSVWINQYNETKEQLPYGNVLEVKGLEELVAA